MTLEKDRVDALIKYWIDCLYLTEWKLDIVLDQETTCNDRALSDVVADVNWTKITFYAQQIRNEQELENCVIHECLHLLFHDRHFFISGIIRHYVTDNHSQQFLRDQSLDSLEPLVERLARTLYYLKCGNKENEKNKIGFLKEGVKK